MSLRLSDIKNYVAIKSQAIFLEWNKPKEAEARFCVYTATKQIGWLVSLFFVLLVDECHRRFELSDRNRAWCKFEW